MAPIGLDFEVVEVSPAEHDSMTGRRGKNADRDLNGAVQSYTRSFDRVPYGSLVDHYRPF
jgi:hypothetical protein